jgi:hypothetical protein
MADAGYPVIRPIYSVTEQGKQILIYEVVNKPSLFDIVRDIETGKRTSKEQVIAAEEGLNRNLLHIYQKTLQYISAEENAQAPIHQLFYHRLTGGRFDTFYHAQDIALPGGSINFDHLRHMSWRINGRTYNDTLDALVHNAIALLAPDQATPSIIGHGDAHNGNVFFDEAHNNLIYFDPAFAGRHSPFLDMVKPLFHNVFAIWLYFPHEIAATLKIQVERDGNTLVVEHNFVPSDIRQAFFRSKIRSVLGPIARDVAARGWLASNWHTCLKLALFCCPFLTMNLADSQKFPPEITLLGLCMSLEMGSTASGPDQSLLDSELAPLIREMHPRTVAALSPHPVASDEQK